MFFGNGCESGLWIFIIIIIIILLFGAANFGCDDHRDCGRGCC
ncbi:MAG: hypothetical protein Q8882_02335 [Bacillota bacterium]|nr:hypothetical protein [Bacillota bacterium]